MAKRRALIVAIETYAAMEEGLAATLAGTHAAAAAFRQWLIDEHCLDPADIYHCAEDPAVPGRTAGATRDEIVQELFRLKTEGKDSTAELYVLFIGHGLCYQDIDGARLADVLLAADYKRREISGNACLKLDEVQRWLRLCMGPADHYYFIDACRNGVSEREIKVGSLGLAYDTSNLGVPTVYTLYSVVEGSTAAADSGFVTVLVDALTGTGRAKVWYGSGMAVLFRSVKDFVAAGLAGQDIDQRVDGGRDGLIRLVAPTPDFACSVEVAGADPADAFVLTVADSRATVVATLPFTGGATSFRRVPDDYTLAITAASATVDPVDPPPADLYSDRTVRFVKRAPPVSGAPASGQQQQQEEEPAPLAMQAMPTVSLAAPGNLRVKLRHLQTGAVTRHQGSFSARMAPGDYAVSLADASRDLTHHRRTIRVGGGAPVRVDLREHGMGALHDALLKHLPAESRREGDFDFSEALGPTGDQGMDLWLALFGASRIVAEPVNLSKLARLPLASFADAKAGEAQFYLLVGLDPAPGRIAVGVSTGAAVAMTPVARHAAVPGLFEHRRALPPGQMFVSLAIDDKAIVTIGAPLLAGAATMLTLTGDGAADVTIQQFVLPIAHLAPHRRARDTPLRDVRQLVEVQRRFAHSQSIAPALPDAALDPLIAGAWCDPVAALLAGYDLARRGATERLGQLVPALRRLLGDAPDVEAIAKAAGAAWRMPPLPPLVLDGLLSLNMPPDAVPFASERLDYRSPWTRWSGAVTATGS